MKPPNRGVDPTHLSSSAMLADAHNDLLLGIWSWRAAFSRGNIDGPDSERPGERNKMRLRFVRR